MTPIATKASKAVNAIDYLMQKYVSGRPDQELLLCEEAENSRIAEAIYTMRQEAGISQIELAKRIGTQKSAISRLEDANYEGHSLGMLRRIADTLGYRMTLTFNKIDKPEKKQAIRKIAPYKLQPDTGKSYVIKEAPGKVRMGSIRPKAAKR